MAKRRRRVVGLIPRLGRGLWRSGRWLAGHPKPFIAVGVLLGGLGTLWAYAQRAEAFRIAHVWLPAQTSLTLRDPLIGTNLFALDIRALADALHRQQPWLKGVRVVRHLPDTIAIETIPRVPIAQVALTRWYAVDEEGFVLPEASAEPTPSLPRLVGLERARPPLAVGAVNAHQALHVGLRVVQKLQQTPTLVSHRLTELNIADPMQIRFVMDGGMEVRCGTEAELEAQLARLQEALRIIAKESLSVRYIDVRFQEPVIGPRT